MGIMKRLHNRYDQNFCQKYFTYKYYNKHFTMQDVHCNKSAIVVRYNSVYNSLLWELNSLLCKLMPWGLNIMIIWIKWHSI